MEKVYDQAYKTEICKRVVKAGEIVPAVAREIGISENTVYTWVSRYKENNVKPFVGSGHVKPENEEFVTSSHIRIIIFFVYQFTVLFHIQM